MDEELLDERGRICRAPAGDQLAPPGLTRFEVQVAGPVQEYAQRFRAVLLAGVERAIVVSTVGPTIARRPVPHWFAAICSGQLDAPSFAKYGAERFSAAGYGVGWDLRGWYTAFEVGSGRTWSWWDLTQIDEKTLSIWVDANGEDFFACTELLWAAYTSGASTVSEHQLLGVDAWRREPAI